ncbi:MAG TPA: FAD-dependent oxidoreductase [Syntrophomonadaceae bacterium]|nr:FAD-dependent oxidoreductase [Syntrophomonadaceae bacterium]
MDTIDMLPEVPSSFWMDSTKINNYPQLKEDLKVDIAIVGGGIVGITTAYLLKQAGVSVVVLDADRILQGTTAHTTSKLTSQHAIIYSKIKSQMSEELAGLYAEANQYAIDMVEKIMQEKSIQCDFVRLPAYTYTQSDQYVGQIEDEIDTARSLGIEASFQQDIPLPFPVKAAMRFENQAQFHCLKFLKELARDIPGQGSHIFEQTKAVNIQEGNPLTVVTEPGHQIKANQIVIASHFPFFDGGGFYFSRIYLERSYVVAATIKEEFPEAHFISAEDPGRSLRYTPSKYGRLVLFGGEHHKTGHGTDTNKHYKNLLDFANQHYQIDKIYYRWSTHDCVTIDGVPYVGNLTARSPNIYVATGFGKWGMSNGIASAKILSDLIITGDNPWAQVYSPSRFITSGSALKTFVGINISVAEKYITGKLEPGDTDKNIEKGEARVIDIDGHRIGAYRDAQGTLHMVDTTCTHLGCELAWNDAEKSWDCPCHGSRFTYEGEIVEGPAINKLQHVKGEPNEVEARIFS